MRISAIATLFVTAVMYAQTPPPAAPPSAVPQLPPAAPGVQLPGTTTDKPIDKNAPEVASHDTAMTFSTRVTLVMVPVIVRDRKGKAIGTFTKDDFQLFDKGKAQVISKFTVEKLTEKKDDDKKTGEGGEPLEAIPSHFVAYLFDDMHLKTGDLMQAREAARKHIAATMKATDRVAIFTTSGKPMLDFTFDRAAIDDALTKIVPRAQTVMSHLECPPVTFYMADQIQHNDAQAYAAAYQDAIQCSSTDPTTGAAALQAMVQSAVFRATARAEQDVQVALGTMLTIISRMGNTPGQRSIVMVSPGFYVDQDFRYQEAAVIDKAIRNKVVISSLDARGLYTIIAGGDASNHYVGSVGTAIVKDRMERESAMAEGETLGEFAEGTGGAWFRNNNDLAEGFRQVAVAPEFEYFIGFSPQNLKYDGTFHQLRVVLKGKDVVIQARRGYFAPNRALTEAEQAKEEMREAFFSTEEMLDIPVALQTQYFRPTPDTARLSVLAHIDLKRIAFRKADGRNLDTLTIVTGVFDRNGNLAVNGIVKTIDLKFKDETMDRHLEAGISAKTSFDVPRGKYIVRQVVRDSEGQTMSALSSVVDIP